MNELRETTWSRTGTLFLLVGPSGVGKDTLLSGARARLEGRGSHVFPMRHITRPALDDGEAHHPVTPETFARQRAAGVYALAWEAHGLCYGVPAQILDDLCLGRHVVVNASRSVLREARETVSSLQIVSITASAQTLRERLHKRGRECDADIEARLARARAFEVSGNDVIEIGNDGTPEAGIARLLSVLQTPATDRNGALGLPPYVANVGPRYPNGP